MRLSILVLLFFFIFEPKVWACPSEIDRTPEKYKASLYEVRLLRAIYKHESSQHRGYCMAVLSSEYNGCRAQVKQALNIIRQEWRRYENNGRQGKFVNHLANRYCPARWDKQGNKNWKRGIRKLLET